MAKKARARARPSRAHRAITDERIDRYLAITERAIGKVRIASPEHSQLVVVANDFLGMARAYATDARHFREQGDLVSALSCVNYAHGWLDAGARLGLFDVGADDQLFTLAK